MDVMAMYIYVTLVTSFTQDFAMLRKIRAFVFRLAHASSDIAAVPGHRQERFAFNISRAI